MAPRASPRALRWTAGGIVAALVLAVVCFCVAQGYESAAAEETAARLGVRRGGLMPFLGGGPPASDVRLGSALEPSTLQAIASGLYCGTLALLMAAAAGTVWCGSQTRDEVRRWHWFSFFGLGFLTCGVTLGVHVSRILWLLAVPWLVVCGLLALLCAIVDLRRRQYGAPGRIVSWSVLAGGLAALVGAGVVFLALM